MTAQVIDLDAYRRRRESREAPVQAAAPAPFVYWPVIFFVPLLALPTLNADAARVR